MSPFNSTYADESGVVILHAAALITFVTAIAALLGGITLSFNQAVQRHVQGTRAPIEHGSAVEMMVLAYRIAEFNYIRGIQSCPTAQPFLQALKSGSRCSQTLTVFSGVDRGTQEGLYTYAGGGCTISLTGSSCGTGSHEILQTSFSTALGGKRNYRIFLTAVRPDAQVVEFNALVDTLEGNRISKSQFGFAIRASLRNTAHLEPNGRVVQQNPDPLSQCPGSPWSTFLLYSPKDRKCLKFSQLGSGTGLTFYKGRYFGLRPYDGQVVDLFAASTALSYLVDESGNLSGTTVFVPYSKEHLVNVPDITFIDNQLYYVGASGKNTHIGMLRNIGGSWNKIPICALGQMGWEQSFEGIAAAGFSDPLIPASDGLQDRMAYFYLKTSTGDLLTAAVLLPDGASKYSCYVFKDSNLQQVEYQRTYGFDRTDDSKPYFIY